MEITILKLSSRIQNTQSTLLALNIFYNTSDPCNLSRINRIYPLTSPKAGFSNTQEKCFIKRITGLQNGLFITLWTLVHFLLYRYPAHYRRDPPVSLARNHLCGHTFCDKNLSTNKHVALSDHHRKNSTRESER